MVESPIGASGHVTEKTHQWGMYESALDVEKGTVLALNVEKGVGGVFVGYLGTATMSAVLQEVAALRHLEHIIAVQRPVVPA